MRYRRQKTLRFDNRPSISGIETTILVTQGGYNGRLLNGDFRVFYPNKNLKENGNYQFGLKEGTWISGDLRLNYFL